MSVNNTGYDGEEYTIALGEATQPSPPSGALIVNFDSNPIKATSPNYNIIAVQEDRFVLIYTCQDFLFNTIKLEYAWILGRERSLDDDTTSSLEKLLVQVGGDPADFLAPNQSNCPI